ncbi:UNVERIFIED_CONTAM: hypothetical protein NCL1_35389 [Trichonephila clavipes]
MLQRTRISKLGSFYKTKKWNKTL